ncbi:AMP-binding enzyme family protein [Mycobacterium ulcerans str. Harvey]|uniref:AMP-binding enzyme family protein n=1 Tax=Mycobacterium ulcerans str. Harvey TaxID=1299332 RepID=A0ABP3AK05_MYCUL|nr:AMP-binding enzyme family protein [Mycobacterium ulcerans str. Harvey]
MPNGDIEYLGRLDNQVQLRGFRIELGDVEAALLALDGVSACHAMVRSDGGESRLVAYVVTHSGEQPEIGPTRRSLAARLPDYMLPAAIVAVESLPLTVNGKIDQKALPEPKGLPHGRPATVLRKPPPLRYAPRRKIVTAPCSIRSGTSSLRLWTWTPLLHRTTSSRLVATRCARCGSRSRPKNSASRYRCKICSSIKRRRSSLLG